MPVDFKFTLQNQALPGVLRLTKLLDGLTPVWKEYRGYYAEQVDSVFEHLAHGGHYRNLYWKPFPESALPHARKRTGLRWYPVRGGGSRLKNPQKTNTPLTLGRRRPSGMRLSSTSKLMQDTGALRKEATEAVEGAGLIFQPSLSYAEKQFKHRSPYSVTPNDVAVLMEMTAKHLKEALLGKGKKRA